MLTVTKDVWMHLKYFIPEHRILSFHSEVDIGSQNDNMFQ